MRLNITRLMRTALPLAVLLLTACGGTTRYITIGGTVTGLTGTGLTGSVVLQDNSVDNLTVPANGAFTFATEVSSFENVYNVTVLTQPAGQTCVVTFGSGTATTSVTSVQVKCANTPPRYAYVVNAGSNDISQYTIAANGTLTVIAAPVAAGTTPYSITVVPSGLNAGKYAYVANKGDGTIPGTVSEYSITNGALNPEMATINAGLSPYSITVDPSGQYVYVANYGDGTVSEYTIGTGGVLTPNTTAATVAAGTNPVSITVEPLGPYVYVANYGSNTVSQYKISSADGTLSELAAPVAAGLKPYSVTVDPSGKYAYVVNAMSSNVSQYTIGTPSSSTPGALTAMSAVPAFTTTATATVATTGMNPASVTVDPKGPYAYVANFGDGTVSQYTIGTGGALTAMATATVAAGTNPYSVTVDPLGQYVYVANEGGNNVSQYTIGTPSSSTPGALTAISAVPVFTTMATATTVAAVAAGAQPISVITAQ
jgi:6-phosphogluconolactonase